MSHCRGTDFLSSMDARGECWVHSNYRGDAATDKSIGVLAAMIVLFIFTEGEASADYFVSPCFWV